MKKKVAKKRNPNDLTGRNLKARNRRFARLEQQIRELKIEVANLYKFQEFCIGDETAATRVKVEYLINLKKCK